MFVASAAWNRMPPWWVPSFLPPRLVVFLLYPLALVVGASGVTELTDHEIHRQVEEHGFAEIR